MSVSVLTSFPLAWPLTSEWYPGELLACSIRAFSCWTLLISVLASSSRYSQVFFCPSPPAGPAPPTGPTSIPLTGTVDGDATAVILAWTGWGAKASAGNAVSTERHGGTCVELTGAKVCFFFPQLLRFRLEMTLRWTSLKLFHSNPHVIWNVCISI